MKFFIFGVCFALSALACRGDSEVVDSEEIAVYRAVLSGTGTVFLRKPDIHVEPRVPEESRAAADAELVKENAEMKAMLKKDYPVLEDSTLDEYTRRGMASAVLDSRSKLGRKVVIVSEGSLAKAWGTPTGDPAIEEEKESVIMRQFAGGELAGLSRVGFNLTKTQALVNLRDFTNQMFAIFLQKENGKWVRKGDSLLSAP